MDKPRGQYSREDAQVGHSDSRISLDNTFLEVAHIIAQRSTCPRAQVGAVLVKERHIISTGYNGAPSGQPHCTEAGCKLFPSEGDHCKRAIHAETNAIASAARYGISTDHTTMYFWDSKGRSVTSCFSCVQLMIAAGIEKVVDRSGAVSELAKDLFKEDEDIHENQ